MTDPTTPIDDPADPAETGPEGVQQADTHRTRERNAERHPAPPDDGTASIADVRRLKRENQTLRARAKAAEQQAADLAARYDAAQRADVIRLAGEHLDDAEDLFRFHDPEAGALMDALRADDGSIDADLVAEHASRIVEARPKLGVDYQPEPTRPPTDRPVESLRPGASPLEEAPRGRSWTDVIQNPSAGHQRPDQDVIFVQTPRTPS
ncbi:hypothetical protein nbrc107696_01440 [Gordonia spumicola]|uniref:Uncharacterized protein n=1 Tax=Gordonia spumicola TaxID=589161 RepID=A0A7I9V2P9_9ACTN|nr:hypothetical protein [Gordonia spumicola]GED99697.1 hypothetical protein nbrc107696_01440 [Gordonia spumicola]